MGNGPLRDTIRRMSSEHTAPPLLSADNPLMPRLYQAAIGPLQTAYYQQQFERFDALGKSLPSWNWAAGCCTLGWMALRGLWRHAAVYAGVLLAVVALWWALGLNQLLPRPAALALALLLVLLAVLLPGLGGNALYHRAVRERTMQALTQSRTLSEAMAQLETQAPTPTRLQWATTGHALSALLVAALVWGLSTGSSPSARAARPAHTGPTQQDTARALAALSPTPAPANPAASTAEAAPAATDAAPASVDSAPADSSATSSPPPSAPETSMASTAAGAAVAAAATAIAPSAAANAVAATPVSAASAAPAPETPALTPPAPAKTAKADKADKAKADKAEKAGKAERAKEKARDKTAADKSSDKSGDKASSKTDKAGKTDKSDKSEPERKRAAAGKTALQPGKYYLNSGIYAQADNAQRVTRRLREAGHPVFTQSLESSKGEVTRIRVGPFDSRAQAEAAASKIQGMKLEAQLFRHTAN